MAQLSIQLGVTGANAVEGAIKGLGSALGSLAGAPLKAVGSLSHAFGGLASIAGGVALGGGLAALPGQMLDMAKAAADDAAASARLSQAITNLGGDFDSITGKVNEAIIAGQKLAFSDDEVRDSFQFLAAATGDADEALARQKAAMDLARGANIPLAQATKLLGKLNEDNIEVFKRMGIVIGENATETDALAAVQKKFGGQAATFANSTAGQFEQAKIAISEIQEAIGSALLPVLSKVGTALVEHLPAIQDGIGNAAALVADTLGPALEAIVPLVQDAFGRFLDYIRPILDVLPDLGTAIQQAVNFFATGTGDIETFRGVLNRLIGPEGAQGVIEVFTNLTGFFQATVLPTFQTLASAVQQAMAGDLIGALKTAGAGLVEFGTGLATSLVEWGRRFIEWVAPTIPPLLAELQMLGERLFAWIKAEAPGFTEKLIAEWVPAFIGWAARAAIDILPKLAAFQGAVIGWILTEGVPAFVKGAIELGGAIIRGVVTGVQRLWPDLQAAMQRMATEALEAAKRAIGARSPSRLFADEVGSPIVEGIIVGVRARGEALNLTLRDMLTLAIDAAKTALAELDDEINNAEAMLGNLETALKPIQKEFERAREEVDRLRGAIGDLQGELDSLAGGGALLPGEKEIRENIFGLKNAINILEQRKRELIRGGASKDDPAVKAIDEEIKRNREELAFQEGKLKAEYDGQRHALEEAAKAGTEVTRSFEDQYARIVAIKAELARLNAEELPAALAAQEAARKELEAQKLAIEQQKEIVDKLKEDYKALQEESQKWKKELDEVSKVAKEIRDRLREAQRLKEKLDSGNGGTGTGAARTAAVTINNTIDARGMTTNQLTQAAGAPLAVLARQQITSGAI